MARSMLLPPSTRRRGEKRIVATGALIEMLTVSLILGGAALVLLGSLLDPRQADPMGMFGLPSVCAVACKPVRAKGRATGPLEIVSRRACREAA